MLNSGKKFRALRDKKNKYSNSCVARKKNSNETKNHNPPFKLNGRSLSLSSLEPLNAILVNIFWVIQILKVRLPSRSRY